MTEFSYFDLWCMAEKKITRRQIDLLQQANIYAVRFDLNGRRRNKSLVICQNGEGKEIYKFNLPPNREDWIQIVD